MTYREFITEYAANAGISKTAAHELIDTYMKTFEAVLRRGDSIVYPGICKFELYERAATRKINPATGEKLEINAKTAPRCRFSHAFKDSIGAGE